MKNLLCLPFSKAIIQLVYCKEWSKDVDSKSHDQGVAFGFVNHVSLEAKGVVRVVLPEVVNNHTPCASCYLHRDLVSAYLYLYLSLSSYISDLNHGCLFEVNPIHRLLSVPVKDDGVHGIVSPHAESVRTDLRISDIFQVPGEHVALHVPCEQPVAIDGNTADLFLMVEAPQAGPSLQVPQLSNPFENVEDEYLPLQTCPRSQRL